jgi:hypothetical protein
MNAIGNHDTRSHEDNTDWFAHAGADAYTKFIAPFISNWGVTHDGNTSHCYYYKDFSSAKVRLVVMDVMVTKQDTAHYDADQITWFESVLASAKTAGLSVVVAAHNAMDSTLIDSTFTTLDYQLNEDVYSNLDPFADAVDAFIEGGGEFITWLCGHTHKDFVGRFTSHLNQSVIVIGCALCNGASTDMARVMGTESQDLFNIIAFDTTAKVVKVVRVGTNYDRYCRHKGDLCYRYSDHTIIYNN